MTWASRASRVKRASRTLGVLLGGAVAPDAVLLKNRLHVAREIDFGRRLCGERWGLGNGQRVAADTNRKDDWNYEPIPH